jgi:hypothetical protein
MPAARLGRELGLTPASAVVLKVIRPLDPDVQRLLS